MRIDKISRLLTALGGNSENPVKPKAVKPEAPAPQENVDAVKVSAALQAPPETKIVEADDSARKARIAERVRSGTYQTDSKAVAMALIRDLGI